MTGLLHEVVAGLAEEAGFGVRDDGDSVRLNVSDGALVVSVGTRTFVVERIERGVVEGVDLETPSRAALDRYLLLVVGAQWRSRRGLPVFQPSPPAAAPLVAPERVGRRWNLRWAVPADGSGGAGEQWASLAWEMDAEDLARVLTVPLTDIALAIRDPQGSTGGLHR